MKEIQLTKGYVTIVDDEDYEMLSSFNWHAMCPKNKYPDIVYASCSKGFMHRMILGLTSRDIQVDHIDGNRLNNQRSNLRRCTNIQNQWCKPPQKTSVPTKKDLPQSIHKGVSHNGYSWTARIKDNGKRIHLGSFKDDTQAAIAYNKKAKELRGEFAYFNQVGGIP